MKQGDICYRRKYADTLERIANEGIDIFYGNSSIANNTIATIQNSNQGIMTLADLANYTAIIRTPVNITYRNRRIFSTVAPSSGTVVLSALKIFEGFNGSATTSQPGGLLAMHQLIQANEFACETQTYLHLRCILTSKADGQRTTYGDPAFTPK